MTDFNPVAIMMFSSTQHAHLVKGTLESQGIRCFVTGDQLADALSVYGNAVAKVELFVDQKQADEANEILAELQLNSSMGGVGGFGTDHAPDWRCAHCGETNGTAFDECWSCSKEKSVNAELVPLEPASVEAWREEEIPAPESSYDPSPYRTPKLESAPSVIPDSSHGYTDRAFRAAVFGLAYPIPLSVLGAYLCVQAWRSDGGSLKIFLAILLSVPLTFVIGVILLAGANEILSLLFAGR